MVIGGRVGQGVGAALLSPAALSVVVRIFEGDERNRALGIWSALGGFGAAVGVLLGGLLTAGPGWSWVFFVNVPVGAVVIVALVWKLPSLPPAGGGSRLDVVGAFLVTAGTGLVIVALIGAGGHGWVSGRTGALLAAGLATYGLLALWLRRTPEPLIDPHLLTRRPVLAGTFILFVTTALLVAVFFLGTFYLQDVAGHGPLATGALFLPVAVATLVGAQTAGRLIGRTGGRLLGVVGLLVAASGLVVPALTLGTVSTVVAVSVGAAGLGALFVVASATALGQVDPHEAGVASGILSTFHELGASLGAAVMSGVAAASLVTGTTAGFERAYLVAAAVAVGAAGVTAVLVPAGPGKAPRERGPVWTFVRHYLEMIVAMLVGMGTLYPLWLLAVAGVADDSWVHRADVESLVMATAMVVPMALWMRLPRPRPGAHRGDVSRDVRRVRRTVPVPVGRGDRRPRPDDGRARADAAVHARRHAAAPRGVRAAPPLSRLATCPSATSRPRPARGSTQRCTAARRVRSRRRRGSPVDG